MERLYKLMASRTRQSQQGLVVIPAWVINFYCCARHMPYAIGAVSSHTLYHRQ